MLKKRSVFALVNEEPRLLAAEPIDMKFQTILHCHICVVLPYYVFVLRIELCLIGQGGFALVIHILHHAIGQLGESVGNQVAREVHTWRVGLHHSRRAVNVDHQARQEIAFAMHQAESIVVGAAQPESLTHLVCLCKALHKKCGVDFCVVESENTHGDAANLIVSVADEVALVVVNSHQVTFFYVVHASNCPRENPGVKSLERFLFTSL